MNALMLVAQTLIDPGDNLVIVAPVWPNIAAAVTIMGGEPRLVALEPRPDGGWRLDLERLFAACDARTRGIFVNSPSNPTGWVISAERDRRRCWPLRAASRAVADRRRGLCPHRLRQPRRRRPFSNRREPEDRLIVVNSFSKSWAMTGWRLGWMTCRPSLLPSVEKLVEFNTSGAPTFLQHAAIVAIRGGEPFIAEMVARCHAARDVAIEGLRRPVAASRWRGRTALSMRFFGWTA